MTDPRGGSATADSFVAASLPKTFPKAAAVSPIASARPEKPPGPVAALVCGINGILVLLVGVGAALLALPQTRPMILEKLQGTPSAGPEAAWGVAGGAAAIGIFYVVCAARMNRSAGFARFAAIAAMGQSALQIAGLVYMTLQGKLDYVTLGFITASLIALCGLIDLAVRMVRSAPAGREAGRRVEVEGEVQPGLV
jgi:hypothetical protein